MNNIIMDQKYLDSLSFFDKLLAKPMPNFLLRACIRRLLKQRLVEEKKICVLGAEGLLDEIKSTAGLKEDLATHTDQSLEQHYAVDPRFYSMVLGVNLKYSSGYFSRNNFDDLNKAELDMLQLSCQRAAIKDGQNILELGCGWGSLTLYMAKSFPNCNIVAMSHSKQQADYINAKAKSLSLSNVKVITCDINNFEIEKYGYNKGYFDRVVSIEMFEHIQQHKYLLQKISTWLNPQGLLFVHHFSHKSYQYDFNMRNSWMAKHFFSGGKMLSSDSLSKIKDSAMSLEQQWQVSGKHYHFTCEAWLRNLNKHKEDILPVLSANKKVAKIKYNYWKIFFLACSELFNYNDGQEWQVEHVLMRPQPNK
jgi:cyclopropane-fatty-acyl-phospholipid synthase